VPKRLEDAKNVLTNTYRSHVDKDWRLNEVEVRLFALLQWIEASGQDFPTVTAFYEDAGLPSDLGFEDVTALAARAWVTDASTMSEPSAGLTSAGKSALADLKARRGNNALRPRRHGRVISIGLAGWHLQRLNLLVLRRSLRRGGPLAD